MNYTYKDPNEITVANSGFGDMLMCPCGSMNLHHKTVTVFSRAEDEVEAQITTVSGGGRVATQRAVHTGPSPRRDGLRVAFMCEVCGRDNLILNILQHKGSTFLVWDESQSTEWDESMWASHGESCSTKEAGGA